MKKLINRPDPVLDTEALAEKVKDKTVLITGAGGSIGSELSLQIAKAGPKCLILLSHSENPLYNIENRIMQQYPDVPIALILADIRSRKRLMQTFTLLSPDLVIHAAAIKHLPMAEENPCEAVLTNLQGTINTVEAAYYAGAKQVVMISTDKAVNPTSVMGATKRAAELYCRAQENIPVTVVRFGNVVGSSGSVIPLFQRRIDEDLPLQVTHEDVSRFFMSIPEAVNLVLKTVDIHKAEKKSLYVLEMGDPIKIKDLAEEMIKESGKEIPIEITGLRAGEKISEELFYKYENPHPCTIPGVKAGQIIQRDFDTVWETSRILVEAAQDGREKDVLLMLHLMVPEYHTCTNTAAA